MYLGGDRLFRDVVDLFLGPGAHPRHEMVTSQSQDIRGHQDREQNPSNKIFFLFKIRTKNRFTKKKGGTCYKR